MHVVWAGMERLVDAGLTKGIGVSNCNGQLVRDMLTYAKHKPVCNQIELNPQNTQVQLVEYLKSVNVQPVAYTPIARPAAVERGDKMAPKDWPDLRNDPYLQGLANKYGKSVCQVMLNWGLCRGHAVIPKAVSIEHQTDNFGCTDFKLTDEEVEGVNALNKNIRLCNFTLEGRRCFFL